MSVDETIEFTSSYERLTLVFHDRNFSIIN